MSIFPGGIKIAKADDVTYGNQPVPVPAKAVQFGRAPNQKIRQTQTGDKIFAMGIGNVTPIPDDQLQSFLTVVVPTRVSRNEDYDEAMALAKNAVSIADATLDARRYRCDELYVGKPAIVAFSIGMGYVNEVSVIIKGIGSSMASASPVDPRKAPFAPQVIEKSCGEFLRSS